VLDAVINDIFWVLPYPEFVEGQLARDKEVIDALTSYTDHPDYARRMKARAQAQGNMPGSD
jgi:hypothetical protein